MIEHRELLKFSGGSRATIVTRNDWLGPDGKKQCEDQRTLVFGGDGDARWIDFDIAIRATAGPVTFGDTKEGAFGLRVAESLRVDSRQGGRIVNSEGQCDAAAWGSGAAWVDYSGPRSSASEPPFPLAFQSSASTSRPCYVTPLPRSLVGAD